MIEAELPDGRILEFPDGTDPAVIQATVKKQLGVEAPAGPQPISQFNDPRGAVIPLVTGAAGQIGGGVLGLAGTIGGLFPGGESPNEKGMRLLESTRDFLTVDAPNEASARAAETIGGALKSAETAVSSIPAALGNFSQTEEFRAAQDPELDASRAQDFRETLDRGIGPTLGEKTLETTGSPALATAAEVAPAALASVVGLKTGTTAIKPRAQVALNAQQKFGLKVDPIASGTRPGAALAEGIGGQAAVQRSLAAQNVTRVRDAAATEIGLPTGVPITKKAVKSVRKRANKAFTQLRKRGELETDKTFRETLSESVQDIKALKTASPTLAKGTGKVVKAASEINKPSLDYNTAVVQVQRLRELSRKAYKANEPANGAAFRSIADAVEDLMDRDLLRRGFGDEVAALREARVLIAKTHTVEDAMKGLDIDAGKFAKALERGEPLSGVLEELGEFATEFPDLVKVSKRGTPPATVTDALTGFGRPALRSFAKARSSVPGPQASVSLQPGAAALTPFLDDE